MSNYGEEVIATENNEEAVAMANGEEVIFSDEFIQKRQFGKITYKTYKTNVTMYTKRMNAVVEVHGKVTQNFTTDYSDISHITVGGTYVIFDIILAVAFVIAAFVSGQYLWCLLFAALCLWCAFGGKVTIGSKGGGSVEIMTSSKSEAEELAKRIEEAKQNMNR